MKIVHYVLSATFAGIEQHVEELVRIQSKDNEIIVICNQSISQYYSNIEVKVVKNISRRSVFGILSLLLILKISALTLFIPMALKQLLLLILLESL